MSPLSILVADDEPDLRELIQLTLQREGHRIVCAPDGRNAGRQLAKDKFDLLITDVLMPDRDGLELITEVRTQYPGMRIIVMTSGGQIAREEYLYIGKRLGAHVALEKPFTRDQLLAAVETAVSPAQS